MRFYFRTCRIRTWNGVRTSMWESTLTKFIFLFHLFGDGRIKMSSIYIWYSQQTFIVAPMQVYFGELRKHELTYHLVCFRKDARRCRKLAPWKHPSVDSSPWLWSWIDNRRHFIKKLLANASSFLSTMNQIL